LIFNVLLLSFFLSFSLLSLLFHRGKRTLVRKMPKNQNVKVYVMDGVVVDLVGIWKNN